ncbi:MAG: thioredoxin domain-containing protein [Alphaproteobacteria bacterium]|nr:thioredoxin domain-containing protein [Alphaproteobacteria bacterium]
MAYRIFLAVIVLLNAFFAWNIWEQWNVARLLDDVPENYSMGPADADLTVVEFLDYSCVHCQKIHPIIKEAVSKDGHVRYIPRPMPSTNPGATKYALAVYAAGEQGKFMDMHNQMIENFRVLSDEVKADLVQKTGLDPARFDKDMNSDAVAGKIEENKQLYMNFYSHSLPQFVIGKRMVFSPAENQLPTVGEFLKMFAEARSNP